MRHPGDHDYDPDRDRPDPSDADWDRTRARNVIKGMKISIYFLSSHGPQHPDEAEQRERDERELARKHVRSETAQLRRQRWT